MTLPAELYVLVTAGHRSTQDEGSPTERGHTDDLARAYVVALRAAGITADWWQAGPDADSDPTMTVGGLDRVANGATAWLAAKPHRHRLLLDCHYNGSSSPIHTIVPDCRSPRVLRSPFGSPTDDTAAVNVLDCRLAKAISAELHEASGLSLYKDHLNLTGVMSEQSTGVAKQYTARLAMFGASARLRANTVRLVIEHAGYGQYFGAGGHYKEAADATVAAITSVYALGKPEVPVPQPDPNPEPIPQPPVPELEYVPGITASVARGLFGSVKGNVLYEFNPAGPVSKLWLGHGQSTGQWPRLTDVRIGTNGAKHFIFSSGLVIWQPSADEALRIVEPEP